MSLKAKIEAVIYASEEPVTLAQLISLLGHEAQGEMDRREGAQQRLALDPAGSADERDDATVEAPVVELAFVGAGAEGAAPDEKQAAREERDRARRLREFFRALLDELMADYAGAGRGLEIREVASGFRLATKPEYHDAVRGFVKSLKPPLKLSLQALETLAVVAYKQPVTGPEISEIRGVDSGGVLGSLMARKLITTAGRKPVIGRPILYKTTRDFLLRFGLKDVSELPSIEEFEKMAGEFAEAEQEEIPMHDGEKTGAFLEERDSHAPQADGDGTPLGASAAERLSGLPPASMVPGADDDPTEAGALAGANERDRKEREFPEEAGSKPSLEPK